MAMLAVVILEIPVMPAVIVKFLSLTSKKIFPEPCTFIRQVVLVTVKVGAVISLDPVLGTPLIHKEKVVPPSYETKISTFAQFTGAALVPFTFQVTVCALVLAQV